ncbi:hypothetical protein ACFLW4_03355 [Chloroflexota bacterium]
MFPSEMVILMAIAVGRESGKTLVTRPMDVTGEYIGYLYDSLVRRDYLKGNNVKGYKLTLKGREALADFLRKNETKVRDTIKRLRQLGIECSQEMDKLGKEAIGVK